MYPDKGRRGGTIPPRQSANSKNSAPLNSCLDLWLLTQPPPEPHRASRAADWVCPPTRCRVSRVILRLELNALARGGRLIEPSLESHLFHITTLIRSKPWALKLQMMARMEDDGLH